MNKKDLKYCTILKSNINVTNMKDTIAYITENLSNLRGDYICVSNVHTTVMAFRDAEYRKVQNSAAMACRMVSRYRLSAAAEGIRKRSVCRDRI